MHTDTVTRSWGLLSCHSSAAITSCFSTMLQVSVLNSWKLKVIQFFHGLHTHQTCHPLSMFGMLWIHVYDCVFQFPPISSNFARPLEDWDYIPQATINSLINSRKRWCCAAWGKWWSHQILTGFLMPRPYFRVSVTNSICSPSYVKSFD